jgi:hypothetical protein
VDAREFAGREFSGYQCEVCDFGRCMPEIEVMAAEMGVCVRTLYRDLAALEEAGWPLPMRRSDDREAA